VVYLKPVQYLETPRGFGLAEFHRYRLIVQTLVDPSEGDAISIQLTATSRQCCRCGYRRDQSSGRVFRRRREASSGAEQGMQETVSQKNNTTAEVSGAGAKIASGLEITHSLQESTLISIGTERVIPMKVGIH
jgi:hypothetical protein